MRCQLVRSTQMLCEAKLDLSTALEKQDDLVSDLRQAKLLLAKSEMQRSELMAAQQRERRKNQMALAASRQRAEILEIRIAKLEVKGSGADLMSNGSYQHRDF